MMEDSLTPVKTVKNVRGNIERFESLSLRDDHQSTKGPQLSNSHTSTPKRSILQLGPPINEEPLLKIAKPLRTTPTRVVEELRAENVKQHERHDSAAFIKKSYLEEQAPSSLADNAREILRCQPSHEDLLAVLQYLQFGIDGRHDFNIHRTNPRAAPIINVLVTITIPDVWANIKQKELSKDEARMKRIIVSSLGSAAGIGALLTQIKNLSSTHGKELVLGDTIMVLGEVLKGGTTIYSFLQDARKLYEKNTDRKLYWQEMTALIAGSRILSTIAQTFAAAKSLSEMVPSHLWLADGEQFTRWLAKNTTIAATRLNATDEELWKFLSQIVKRAMNLGHRNIFVSEFYQKLLLGQRAYWTPVHLVLEQMAPYEQKSFFDCIVSDLAQRYLATSGGPAVAFSCDPSLQRVVAGAAALIVGLVKNNAILEEHMESWLSGTGNSSAAIGLLSRRVLVAALGRSEEKLQRILEKSLASFGDKLQIRHATTLQQEAMAQTILLIIGSLNRIDVNLLKRPSISTLVMHAVSNRLAASIPRTRLLGMIVGTAVSRLVDSQKEVLDFGTDEIDSEDAKSWLELVTLNDYIGDLIDIQPLAAGTATSSQTLTHVKPKLKTARINAAPQVSKIISINEVDDSTSSEDDDLIPYQKPDTDAEDSEDDPTLINRSKPSAPVYIVDLISQLQMSEKPDIVAMALRTAPDLIRRKSAFGTEVSDNVNSLVTILVSLQEGMTEPGYQELRLESLIACVVAKPELVGPSLAELYFQGDFSLFQRITILTAVGLAARQMAGFEDEPTRHIADDFPSKRLPSHLEPQNQRQITATRNPVEMLTDTAAHSTVRPMALAAADKATGPSALKIRTFSSRMEVEKKKQEKTAARTKKIPKNLHRLLEESIYIPLCSRMSMLLSHTTGGHLPNTTILHSSTVRLFLQTLTLILHTLGPSASLHLPTLSQETLLLLMNLHTIMRLSADPAVLPALLHLLLALLDITVEAGVGAQERLITEFGIQVTQLVNWSNDLRNKMGVPESEESGISWTVLAAGIQVKWYEIGQRFQARMLGLSLDEMEQLAKS